MEVRPLDGQADVFGIIRANALAWREAYAGLLPDEILEAQSVDPSPEEVSERADAFVENARGVFVAVDDRDQVRGYVDFRWGEMDTKPFVGEHDAELKAIYVEPEYWGNGVGTALLQTGLEAVPTAVSQIRLEVLSGNEDARHFYESRGFERTGTGTVEIAGGSYPTSRYGRDHPSPLQSAPDGDT